MDQLTTAKGAAYSILGDQGSVHLQTRAITMQVDLKRTGETALTDEQLILLDVMFNCRASFQALCHDHFHERWCHSHHLDHTNLQETLNGLCQAGILQTHTTSEATYFSFTSQGGKLWELERMPVWSRY